MKWNFKHFHFQMHQHHIKCWNYFRKWMCCTFSRLRIDYRKNTKLHRGPLGVLRTDVQLGIDSTHSFNGNPENSTSTTPARHALLLYAAAAEVRQEWGGEEKRFHRRLSSPSQDQLALQQWCIPAGENSGDQRSTTPGLMDISTFTVILTPAWINFSHIPF